MRTNGAVLHGPAWNYKDTWRLSVGANYHYNDQWMFRGGIAWDQTPTNDTDRSVRLPDSDRVWLSVGAQYKMGQELEVRRRLHLHHRRQSPSVNQYPNATPTSIAHTAWSRATTMPA